MKITLLVIAALSLAGAAKADPTTPEQQQRPNEKPLSELIQKKDREKPIRACWHPGLARNIGIAEQSCDALSGPSSPAPSIERLPLPPRPNVHPPNAEAGCSANEIAAVSGHASLREVERYTRAADQARMARNAMARAGN